MDDVAKLITSLAPFAWPLFAVVLVLAQGKNIASLLEQLGKLLERLVIKFKDTEASFKPQQPQEGPLEPPQAPATAEAPEPIAPTSASVDELDPETEQTYRYLVESTEQKLAATEAVLGQAREQLSFLWAYVNMYASQFRALGDVSSKELWVPQDEILPYHQAALLKGYGGEFETWISYLIRPGFIRRSADRTDARKSIVVIEDRGKAFLKFCNENSLVAERLPY